ncbi:N-acyl-aromatic-L-amino acid amidohydrolase (carboxylate-forming) B-like [Limanda limanda]|uniref:N-acyl-aromatic-L-amino acid amidohydrolase (carboxylate-forming) B-like n=1 Tax=Limanda limanda TaxID=27771 RepID=UPI0029C78E67|nr:N-acyl-aromatic-L-amino acid amidohydrolase (carboxylate-forming) B-like [Limanda limanda]
MYYLKIYLVGEARRAVEGFFYRNSEDAYTGAWKWGRIVDDNLYKSGDYPDFKSFTAFLNKEARISCNPITSPHWMNFKPTVEKEARSLNTTAQLKYTTRDAPETADYRGRPPCVVCKDETHGIVSGTSSPVTDSSTYELRRAQELNAQLGPKGSEEAVDLVCDLHNTTSNMGLCIILYSSDWLILHIYKYLQSKITSVPVRAIQIDLPRSQAYSLDSLGKHGFSIEVGPQPHGVLRADIFNAMKEAVDLTIEWLQQFNSGKTFEGGEVETYTADKKLDYPRDPTTNEITAAIHPQLQDNDFKLLRPGDPIFLSFSGETVRHEGEELYPFFVNEGATTTAFLIERELADEMLGNGGCSFQLLQRREASRREE